jgi:hypothetical protein
MFVTDIYTYYYRVYPLPVKFIEIEPVLSQKLVTYYLVIVLIVGIVDNPLCVTFIVTHLEVIFE